MIGSTKVNTFRVSAVSEDVFFGNPHFNERSRPEEPAAAAQLPVSFQDQQSARANRRLDVAYGADNVFAWFLPGKGGDHDLKFGVNYLYSSLRVQDFGNHERHVHDQHRPAVRRQPTRAPIRSGCRSACRARSTS